MLFQSFYNWLKYKTLPPSILFKNRLFLERNSQKYRLFSTLGSTFRSSKWNLFSQINVKKPLATRFKKIFFLLIFFGLIFFLLTFFRFYQVSSIFNSLSFLFWVNVDSFDYYLSFLVWFLFFFFSFLTSNFYSFFFFNNFSTENETRRSASYQNFFNPISSFSSKNVYASNADLNWLAYTWFADSAESSLKKNAISNLFNANLNKKLWNEHAGLFISLYKALYYINLTKCTTFNLESSLFTLTSNSTYNLKKFSNFFGINFFGSKNYLKFELFAATLTYNPLNSFVIKRDETKNYLIKKNFWVNSSLSASTSPYNYLLRQKLGIFSTTGLTFEKLNYLSENVVNAFNFNANLAHTAQSAKITKWLYKYSVLNRKIFKNSNKITNLKRNFSSSFVEFTTFNRNLWNTNYFALNNNFSVLNQALMLFNFTNLNNVSYLLNETIQPLFSKNLNIQYFSNFETSYFWALKRFFLFNNTVANFFNVKFFLVNAQQNFLFKFNDHKQFSDMFFSRYSFLDLNVNHELLNVTRLFGNKNTFVNSATSTAKQAFNSGNGDLYLLLNNIFFFSTNDLKLISLILNSEVTFNKFFFLKYFSTLNSNCSIKKNNFTPNPAFSKKLLITNFFLNDNVFFNEKYKSDLLALFVSMRNNF